MHLIGIYDADASITGAIRYLLRKVFSNYTCALCDLTHGWNPLGKSAWRKRAETEPNIIWLHRDEAPEGLLNAVEEKLPCVVADHGHRVEMLLDSDALQACKGNFATFTVLLEEKLRALHDMQAPAAQKQPGD